jgi:cytochrome b561
LYGLLIVLPVTGTLAMYVSQAFAPVHRALAWTLLGFVILHILGALWHQIMLKDGSLSRILPFMQKQRGG